MITYGRSIAEETTRVTNNTYTDVTNSPNLITNMANGPTGPISYNMGNGTLEYQSYDLLGRVTGKFLCKGVASPSCQGGTQLWGEGLSIQGNRLTSICDTVNACYTSVSYDDMSRLINASAYGTTRYSYSYDRYGNHIVANGVSYSFNAANNQQTNFGYDAAGNQLTDASHTYTYDAEGKVLKVDSGTTAAFVYDPLDHRISKTVSGSTQEYSFDDQGRRRVSWTNNFGVEGRIYWDGGLLGDRSSGGQTYFHQTDYLGTERLRTNYQGSIFTQQTSGPFGENYQMSVNNSNGTQDNNAYTSQERDAETNTEHFQYRQYSELSGRWMSPDPYGGSYDPGNPQSMNRFAYVLNNPLSYTDPSGYDDPDGTSDDDNQPVYTIHVTTTIYTGQSMAPPPPPCSVGSCVPVFFQFPTVGPQGNMFANFSGGGSGGGTQPGAPKKQNPFICGANAADKVSVAGAAHKIGVPESGALAFATDAIGGNTFSALTNTVTTFASHFQNQGGHNAFYNAGQSLVAGPTQGLGALAGKSIESTPFAAGPLDILLGRALGDAAGTVGAVKLGYDAITYVGAVVGCAAGVVH